MIRLIIMIYEHIVLNLRIIEVFEELLREIMDKKINNSPFFDKIESSRLSPMNSLKLKYYPS